MHERYEEWIDRMLDGDLSDEQEAELTEHLKECDACFSRYIQLKKIKDTLGSITFDTLDDAWMEDTMEKINQEQKPKHKKIGYKRIIAYAASFVFVFALGVTTVKLIDNLGGKSPDGYYYESADNSLDYYGESSGSYENDLTTDDSIRTSSDTEDESTTISSNVTFDAEKIIYSGNMTLYVDEYGKSYDDLKTYLDSIGGFVDYSYYYRNDDDYYDYSAYGYVQIRVPYQQFDATMELLKGYGKVTYSSVDSTNVTQYYQDLEGQLKSYRIQEERLLGYLEEAKDVSDMITIETELNRVRTQINYLESSLRNYDNLIEYSTIYITMYEQDVATVNVDSPFGNFFKDIQNAFAESINFLLNAVVFIFLWIIRLLPYLAIALVIVLIVRAANKKKSPPIPMKPDETITPTNDTTTKSE